MNQPRRIETRMVGQPTSDGAGVSLTRVFAGETAARLDPFLMLDEFGSDRPGDYIAGFPDHPHRGFETITVMLHGRMRHRDSSGNNGLIESGGVQWMTAGRGVIHSEMPEQSEGLMQGFQLWLNLPAAEKMKPAGYDDHPAADIPEIHGPGSTLRLIAGQFPDGEKLVSGPIQRHATQPFLALLYLQAGADAVDIPISPALSAFAYVWEGAAQSGEGALGLNEVITCKQLALYANDTGADFIRLAPHNGPASILIGAGKPLREPIVQYGPFVMNTRQEIEQAVRDYQTGRLVQAR